MLGALLLQRHGLPEVRRPTAVLFVRAFMHVTIAAVRQTAQDLRAL